MSEQEKDAHLLLECAALIDWFKSRDIPPHAALETMVESICQIIHSLSNGDSEAEREGREIIASMITVTEGEQQ